MKYACKKCNAEFDADSWRAYCDDCIKIFKEIRQGVMDRQHPWPGTYLDGKFADPKECPQSFADPGTDKQVCGLCGSDKLDSGYGLGSGYGIGVYTFCNGCNNFLDFSEDRCE